MRGKGAPIRFRRALQYIAMVTGKPKHESHTMLCSSMNLMQRQLGFLKYMPNAKKGENLTHSTNDGMEYYYECSKPQNETSQNMNALYFGCWLKPQCYTGLVLTQCSRKDGDRVVSELHMVA